MSKDFEQISLKPGFMKHNGGLLFRTISENEYEFKTKISENHLNTAKITHGGFIAALVDSELVLLLIDQQMVGRALLFH